jgi:hypothetical protein
MKEDSYNPAAIEKEVQAYWKKNKSFEVNPDEKKRKILLLEYVSISLRRTSHGSCAKLHDRRCNF